jgi:hypothetical protein
MAVKFGGAREGLVSFGGDVDILDSSSINTTKWSPSRREVNQSIQWQY